MKIHCHRRYMIPLFILLSLSVNSAASLNSVCELSVSDSRKVYNYSLVSPTNKFPHGVLSEDGFYRVSVNETVLWFQLCSGMIFNHDPPRCLNCSDCGGPTHCGMACSAVVSNDIEGYPVCTTLGHVSSMHIDVADKSKLDKGVIIKMSINGRTISDQQRNLNCSLSVSVLCDSVIQGPQSLEKSGSCDYATVLRHPTGCAKVVYVHGKGWGWFGILFTLSFCLLGGYLLAGTVYRYFALGVRGIDIVPNLELWSSLPHRTQTAVTSLIRRLRGPSAGYRSSYSPVDF